jgi:hypothetical protein
MKLVAHIIVEPDKPGYLGNPIRAGRFYSGSPAGLRFNLKGETS